MKVMYITSGHLHYPHSNLDNYIIRSLDNLQDPVKVFYLNVNENWFPRLLTELEGFKPNFAFTIHGQNLHHGLVARIKKMGIKVGLWCVDDPYDIDSSLPRVRGYDYIFTTEKLCKHVYEELNEGKVFYNIFGTQTQVFYPETPEAGFASDICLIGSPFKNRVEAVNYLLSNLPTVHFKLVGPGWSNYFSGKADILERAVNPDEMRKFYNGARINLNIYRKFNESLMGGTLNSRGIQATTPNVRTFDIAACNSFQLATHRDGIQEFFDLSTELITFNNMGDLLRKVVYYLYNSTERKKIARKAYQKTLEDYRLEIFLQLLVDLVKHDLSGGKYLVVNDQFLKKGYLIKGGESPAVYWVLNGYKHIIPSIEIFEKLNFRWEEVNVVNDLVVNRIPDGIILRG